MQTVIRDDNTNEITHTRLYGRRFIKVEEGKKLAEATITNLDIMSRSEINELLLDIINLDIEPIEAKMKIALAQGIINEGAILVDGIY